MVRYGGKEGEFGQLLQVLGGKVSGFGFIFHCVLLPQSGNI